MPPNLQIALVAVPAKKSPSDADETVPSSRLTAKTISPEGLRARARHEGMIRGFFTKDSFSRDSNFKFRALMLNSGPRMNLADLESLKIQYYNDELLRLRFPGQGATSAGKRLSYMRELASREFGFHIDKIDDRLFREVAKDSFQLDDELAESANKAALLGIPASTAFADFRKAHQNGRGWSSWKDGRGAYERMHAAIHQSLDSRLTEHRPMIDEMVGRLRRIMGVEKAPEAWSIGDVAGELLMISKEDRDLVLQAIIEKGDAGQKDKKFATSLADNLGRGIQDVVLGPGQHLDWRAQVAYRSALQEEKKRRTGEVKAGFFDRLLPNKLGERFLRVEDLDHEIGRVTQVIDWMDLRHDVQEIGEQHIDPAKGDGFWSQGILDAARSLPSMAMAMVPGGPVVLVGQFAEQNRHVLRREFPDMPAEKVALISGLAAPLQALVETASDRLLIGRLPNLTRMFKAPVTTWGSMFKRTAGFAALGLPTQIGEEVAQDLTPYAVQSVVAALDKDVSTVPWARVLGQMDGEYFKRLTGSIIPLVLVGSGSAQLAEFAHGKFVASSAEMLEAAGYTAEVAAEVSAAVQAGDLQGAERRMQQSYEAGEVVLDGAMLTGPRDRAVEVHRQWEQQQQTGPTSRADGSITTNSSTLASSGTEKAYASDDVTTSGNSSVSIPAGGTDRAQVADRVAESGHSKGEEATPNDEASTATSPKSEVLESVPETGRAGGTAHEVSDVGRREAERAAADGRLTYEQRMEQANALRRASKGVSTRAIEEAARDFDASNGVSFLTTVQDKLASDRVYLANFDFGKYVEEHLGPKPFADWHAHHILIKRGHGEWQQALVREGQKILRTAGIHPVFGLENFVWAPQRVKEQHGSTGLEEVVDELRKLDVNRASYGQFASTLKRFGRIAARRR